MGLSSYCAINSFHDLNQLSVFLPVVYLGNLEGVSKFCDSAHSHIFITINNVIVTSTLIKSKIGRVMRRQLLSPNFCVSGKQLRKCP